VLVDCDVDAADLHLLLQPEVREEHEFWSGQYALIDTEKCTRCGLCQELCRFHAVRDFSVDRSSCEGCGFCAHVCPAGAIKMKENLAGLWFISNTKYGSLVHARLGVAQENSGKLVALVRKQAIEIAEKKGTDTLISDGPPGIGCPVISSLTGANLALLVTEPTLTAMHDLDRVYQVCNHFNVPAVVCINKFDINKENTLRIEEFCDRLGITVGAKLPFDNIVCEAIVHGKPVVEYANNLISQKICVLWQHISHFLNSNGKNA
jgi:MinD superfamily P-loop ATPase